MEVQKHKEPLLALMLSFFLMGLGQIYIGEIKRGSTLLIINFLILTVGLNFLLNPAMKTHVYMIGLILILCILGVYNLVDAYLSAKKHNERYNIHHNIGFGQRVLFIIGIFLCFYINVNSLILKFTKANEIKAFKVSDNAMNPILNKDDRILARSYKGYLPQRGDVVILEYPGPGHRTSIKRFIALPGELVEIKKDGVYVDNIKIEYPELKDVDLYNRKGYNGGESVREFKIAAGFYYLIDKKMGAEMPLNNLLYKASKVYYPYDRSGEIK